MFKKLLVFSFFFVMGIVIAVPVSAHTPMLYVEDYGDGTIYLEGGFSDGSSASGTEILLVEDKDFDNDTAVRDKYLEFIFNSVNFEELADTYLKIAEENGAKIEGNKVADFSKLEAELLEGKLIIFKSQLDDFSSLNLPKPEGSYLVVFNAGPGHTVVKKGAVLTEDEKALLE
ncbi:hypothetical protein GM661_13380 [Iocasia frigidifontis]|uniref:Uncharacterized protein n=1 Tax=Iocasia fonsfrigidae TaxID=2682810 RepID=A0A8A7KAN4_9FIRM|nr:hypothetical protein [Iocasia fonsfrigidae]QTL98883.1 hypothetical protein GM661_13380 [Iocasia fonsfrigidae]